MRISILSSGAVKYGLLVVVCITFLCFIIKYSKEPPVRIPNFINISNYEVEVSINPNMEPSLSRSYEYICQSDKHKTDLIKEMNFKSKSAEDLRQLFNKFIMNPHIGRCPTIQRFGGEYIPKCKYWDGQKFVCMNELYKDLENDDCLIYSFGIASDYSFEEAMDRLGCKVYAFDPTVNYSKKIGNTNILFEKLGVSTEADHGKSLDTLTSILHLHGHTDTKITYLKVDIEGYEVDGLGEWFASGALQNVQQIALEYHLENTEMTLKLFHTLIRLYFEGDFRLISFDINGCARAASRDYYKYAEIVLMKPSEYSVCIEKTTVKR